MPIVNCREVRFSYRRRDKALDGISFEIGPGVTGIMGPNGAGKTTLLRLIAGLQKPRSGVLDIDNESPDSFRASGRIGLIPEIPVFDDYLTVGDFIAGLSDLMAVDHGGETREALNPIWTKRLASLSLGQKRRVELAAALIGNPDLILLDEPTNGLDPFAVVELRKNILGLNDGARTIIISSHHLDELQRTADQVVLLANGRCYGVWNREAAIMEFGSMETLFQRVIEAPLQS